MNREELIKEYDEKAKALRDEFISKLEDDKKVFKSAYPKDNEIVFYISSLDGKITQTWYWEENNYDLRKFEQGQYFKTYKEAERYLKECKLLFKLKQWAKFKNKGWKPDWEDIHQGKYHVFYDYYRKELYFSFNYSTSHINKLPYFKSQEIAQECINLFGEEIKEVLC